MIATMEQIKEMENNTKVKNTKFEINAETLKGIKNIFKGHKKPSLPVLDYISVEIVNKNVIKVKYTNHDLWVEKMFYANVEHISKKAFLLPIEFFKGIKYIKKNETFLFEQANEDIVIFTRNNINQKVTTMDFNEYPNFDFLEQDEFTNIETSTGYEYIEYNELNVLNKATKSVSDSETRPVLKEVFINGGFVTSTDSHRLYRAKSVFNLEEGFLINPSLIKKAIDVMDKKMLLKMAVNNNRIKIQDEYTTKIYYNHYEGNFPDTSRLIPNEYKYVVDVDRVNELYDFLKSFKKEIVNIEIDSKSGEMKLEVKSNSGTSTINLPVRIKESENDNFKFSLNTTYFKEAIEQMDKEPLQLNVVSNVRPLIVKKQRCEKELALILPVRTY